MWDSIFYYLNRGIISCNVYSWMTNYDEEKRNKFEADMKKCSNENIAVLKTLLDNCSKSSNRRLKADLQKHNIPKRFQEVTQILLKEHDHDWHGGRKAINLIDCVKDEENWNGWPAKLEQGILGWGAVEAQSDLWVQCDPDCSYYYLGLSKMESHAKEVKKEFKELVEEIDALHSQMRDLMASHSVK